MFFFILLQVSVFMGLENELFYMDKTMMVFGDAKKVIEDMARAVERGIVMSDIKLLEKNGGKSGAWVAEK